MRFIGCIASKPGLLETTSLDLTKSLNIISSSDETRTALLTNGLFHGISNLLPNKQDYNNTNCELNLTFALSSDDVYNVHYDENNRVTLKEDNSKRTLFSDTYNSYEQLHQAYSSGTHESDLQPLISFSSLINANTFMTGAYVPSIDKIDSRDILSPDEIDTILLQDKSRFYFSQNRTFLQRDKGIFNKILIYERKLHELDKQLNIADIKESRISKLNSEKDRVDNEINKLEKSEQTLKYQLDILNKILDNLKQIDNLNSDLLAIREKVNREEEKVKNVSTKQKELSELFPHFKNVYIGSDKNLDKLQTLFHEVRNINEEIDTFHLAKEKKFRKFRKFVTTINLFAISFFSYFFYINNYSFETGSNILKSISLFILLFTPFSVLFYKIASNSKKLALLHNNRKRTIERLKILLTNSNIKIENHKLSDLYGILLQYFEDYIDYSERKKEIRHLRYSLKDNDYLKDIHQKLYNLKRQEELIKNDIIRYMNLTDNIREDNLSEEAITDYISTIQDEIEKLQAETDIKYKLLDKINLEIRPCDEYNDDIARLQQDKEEIKLKLEKLKAFDNSQKYIFTITSEVLENKRVQQQDLLIHEILNNFNMIRGNNQSSEIDHRTVKAIITKNIYPQNISQTDRYALMIAVKLALTVFMDMNDNHLPLIINEPFKAIPGEREHFFKELINTIAKKRQIIIFTNQKEKENWGNYLEL